MTLGQYLLVLIQSFLHSAKGYRILITGPAISSRDNGPGNVVTTSLRLMIQGHLSTLLLQYLHLRNLALRLPNAHAFALWPMFPHQPHHEKHLNAAMTERKMHAAEEFRSLLYAEDTLAFPLDVVSTADIQKSLLERTLSTHDFDPFQVADPARTS